MSIEDIILKEIQGEALDPKESAHLRDWLEEDPAHAETYAHVHLMSRADAKDLRDDSREVKARIESAIYPPYRVSWPKYLGAAAVLLLLVVSSLVFWSSEESEPQAAEVYEVVRSSDRGSKLTTALSDGSKVKLNSGSRLVYTSLFGQDKREVRLVGDAFFEVEPDGERPFIIHAGDLTVTVIGTSFVVNRGDEASPASVGVKNGQVAVATEQNDDVIQLIPGEVSIYSPETGLKKVDGFDADRVFGWVDNKLVFNDNTFEQVKRKIERWYGVELIEKVPNETAVTFSSKHENPSLEEVLETFTHVYQINYEINGDTIYLLKENL